MLISPNLSFLDRVTARARQSEGAGGDLELKNGALADCEPQRAFTATERMRWGVFGRCAEKVVLFRSALWAGLGYSLFVKWAF